MHWKNLVKKKESLEKSLEEAVKAEHKASNEVSNIKNNENNENNKGENVSLPVPKKGTQTLKKGTQTLKKNSLYDFFRNKDKMIIAKQNLAKCINCLKKAKKAYRNFCRNNNGIIKYYSVLEKEKERTAENVVYALCVLKSQVSENLKLIRLYVDKIEFYLRLIRTERVSKEHIINERCFPYEKAGKNIYWLDELLVELKSYQLDGISSLIITEQSIRFLLELVSQVEELTKDNSNYTFMNLEIDNAKLCTACDRFIKEKTKCENLFYLLKLIQVSRKVQSIIIKENYIHIDSDSDSDRTGRNWLILEVLKIREV